MASDAFKFIKELNKGYWAQSTLAVKKSRREEICKLARMVAPQGIFLPLSKEIVEATAAALKAAKLASADQYLGELKLMQIEAGFAMEPWYKKPLGGRLLGARAGCSEK